MRNQELLSVDKSRLYVWDLESAGLVKSYPLEPEINGMARVDESTFCTLHNRNQLIVRKVEDPTSIANTIHLSEELKFIKLNKSQNTLLGSSGNTVHLLNFTTGELIGTMRGHAEPINDAISLLSDSLIVSCSGSKWRYASAQQHDHTIRLWNESCRQNSDRQIQGHPAELSSVRACAFDPSRNNLLTSDTATTLVWDALTAEHLDELPGAEQIQIIRFREKTLALFRRGDKTEYTFDPSYRQTLAIHNTGNNLHCQIIPFSDNQRLLFATSSGLLVYDFDEQRILGKYGVKRTRTGTIDLAPNQNIVLACYESNFFCLWDIESGRRLITYREKDGLNEVKFLSDTEIGVLTQDH